MNDTFPLSWRIRTAICELLYRLAELIEVDHGHTIMCDCTDGKHFEEMSE